MKKLIFTMFFMGLITLVLSSLHLSIPFSLSAQIPSDCLVAWYPFNGNANDESGNGNHGTVNGATLTSDRFGNAQKAFSLASNPNYMSFGSGGNSSLNITTNFSTSVWIKTSAGSTNGGLISFGDNVTSPPNAAGYLTCINGGNVGSGKVGISTRGNWYSSNSLVNNNQWRNIISVYNNGELTIYIDGNLDANYSNVANPLSWNGNRVFGTRSDLYMNSNTNYIGLLDDMAIYNRALSPSEIQQLYQDQTGQLQSSLTCSITTPTTTICEGESVTLSVNTTGGAGASSQLPANLQQGLVAYYPFNGNANDESGNGNNGVIGTQILAQDRFGQQNSAYQFFRDYNKISISNSILPSAQSSFSISFWFNPQTMSTIGVNGEYGSDILCDRPSNGWMYKYRFLLDQFVNGTFRIRYYSINGNQGSGVSHLFSSSNNWYHVSVTTDFSANTVSMYFNGVLVDSYFGQIYYPNQLSSTTIGGNVFPGNLNGDPSFLGYLDEIRFYNRALSPSEIQQLYTAQSYAWSNNATTPTITVTPVQNTTYNCTVTQGDQTCTASVDITVNPNVTNAISATIIEGETYTLGAQTLTTAGTYTEVFTSAAGCDSTVTLTLSVEPLLTCNITTPSTVLCSGQSTTMAFNSSSNLSQDSLLIDAFTMTVSSYFSHYSPVLENGKTYRIRANGRYGFADGWPHNDAAWSYRWDETTQTRAWCNGTQDASPDVRWILNGLIDFARPDNDIDNNISFCSGNDKLYFWTISGNNASYHFEWIDGAYGDNSGSLNFEIYEIVNSNINLSTVWSTNETTPAITVTPAQNTTYNCTVTQGNQTCTASVDITVNPNVTNIISATIIEGETYTLGTQTLTTAGTYTEVFTSAAGCDSTVTLTLSVEPLLTCEITAPTTTLCEGESVTLSVNTTGGAGASSQLPANLQQGLVAYYPFNGNANDESGNGNDGVVNGATLTADRFGNAGSAFSFSGFDNISISQNPQIQFGQQTDFTYSTWFIAPTEPSQLNDFRFFASYASTDVQNIAVYAGGFQLGLNNPNHHILLELGSTTGELFYGSSDVTVQDWHHFSISVDRNLDIVYSYLDGQLIGTTVIPDSHSYTPCCNSPLLIGGERIFNPQHYFMGDIDDISIYNRALSPSEIQQLYTAQSYAWSNNATTPTITISPTQNATYSCTVTQGNQTCTASVDITVNPNVTNTISATIIEGETYTLGTQTLTTAGTYTEVFASAAGCDSTVTLTLSVEPLLTCEITAPTTTLCEGESVTLSINTTGGASASSLLPANLQQGLVAYYPFNGNANDESGNGNDGVVNGATLTTDRFGNTGKAFDFDGVNDGISVTDSDDLDLVQFTLGVWVNVDQVPSTNYTLLNKGRIPTNTSGTGYQIDISYQNLSDFQYTSSIQKSSGSQVNVFSNAPVSYGSWKYCVSTFDGNVLKLYVNGSLNMQASSLPPDVSNELLTIGYMQSLLDNRFFNGKLDDIVIYNRALSQSEIQQLFITQSYAWSTNATTPTITVSPTQNTTYSCTVTQGNQTCTASVDITVNSNITNNISATIIEGETYTLGTQTLTTAGTYMEVFTSSAGCDSTVTLTLSVEPLLTCSITAPTTTLCEGESVTLSVNTTGGAGASSQLPANLQQGLVAYYPFNGNANDESGNGNDGVVDFNQVSITSDRFNSLNGAFEFIDALGGVQISNFSFPHPNYTVSLWCNVLFDGNAVSSKNIISHDWNNGGEMLIYMNEPDAQTINFDCRPNIVNSISFPVSSNTWYHFVAVRNGNQFSLFANGVNVGSDFKNLAVSAVAKNLYIGGDAAQNLNDFSRFNGKIDDVAIYNRALSPSEIQQLYNAQSYAWSNNATSPTITVAPSQNTTYSCTVTQGNQTCTASVDITVNPNVTNTISATIIEGETYILGTQTLTAAGTYTEVFTSATGCDSTVTLTLAVEPLLTCEITAPTTTLCEGESVTLSINTTGGAGASSQLPTNLQQGLVAYYPFNGNANDESGNGLNLSNFGALLVSDRFSNESGAYEFNGSNYLQGVTEFPISGNSSRSVSFWCAQYSNDNNPVVSWGPNIIGNRFNVGFNYGGQGLWAGAAYSGILYSYNQSDISNWHHYVFTFDSFSASSISEVEMYQDGELLSTSPFFLNPSTLLNTSSGYPLEIGQLLVTSEGLQGKVDDIAIYNRALTPAEIQQLYTAQSYAWSNNATTPTITVTPTQNTTYSCTVTQGNQTCTASVDITVNPNVTNTISATIIEGETYTLGTQTLTTAGTYTEVFTSATGCDSTVTLTLTVEPLLTCEITAPTTTLCEGESVTLSVNTTGGAGASSQLPANLQQGLVAYYPFNGNANDESGNGNNGTVNGATLTSDRFGNLNGAYGFNSSNILVNIPNSTFQSDFTISAWVSLDQQSSQTNYPTFITQENSYLTMQFEIWPIGAEPLFNCYFLNNYNIGGLQTEDGHVSAPVAYNSWTEVTLRNSSGINYLYVNGILVDVSNQSSLIQGLGAGNYLLFGSGDLLPIEKFIGQLDDITIYNRALSPSEIQQLYTAQSYAWSTGATTPTITVSPTQTTTYTATVTTATQTCTDSITIAVNPLLNWYADADADGFGNPDDVVQDCNQPVGYTSDNTDCNDEDATTYPGASEICDNNRDENCDGVDSLCFVAILGCTDINACNFNPEANTEDNSCILPQPEICNGLDDNCNGQVDEGFSVESLNVVPVTTAIFPVCVGNAVKSANLNTGANSGVIAGEGNDLWFSFTAQYNAVRVGLSAATGDNEIQLFQLNNGCLQWLQTEHETYTSSTLATGNQTLITDELITGNTYYVAIHHISGPINTSAKVCFNHFVASTCDHYYSNNTGVYPSVCSSFKAQYQANAIAYRFEVLSATQNNINQNITPWSYTTTSSSSVISRLGNILPANMGTSAIQYTMQVPVLYAIPDAAGNLTNIEASATQTCQVVLSSQPTIALRLTDRCPTLKSLTSTIAPDRTVCGAMRYDWEFTEVLPVEGLPQIVAGGTNATVFFLSNVPGITVGKTYSVRVRPVHSSNTAGQWGTAYCLRVGAAGMIQQSESESGSVENIESRVSSISIYPNPTTSGSFVLQYNGPRRGELTFIPDATTEPMFMEELVMMDITGKVVFKTNVVLSGNIAEIHFGDLESGLYLVDFGGERSRLQVVR